jgi:hypothetical protein
MIARIFRCGVGQIVKNQGFQGAKGAQMGNDGNPWGRQGESA